MTGVPDEGRTDKGEIDAGAVLCFRTVRPYYPYNSPTAIQGVLPMCR